MDLLLCIFIFLISFVIFRLPSGMLILSLFFGIPQTIKLRNEGILFKNAPIVPFLKTILLQFLIISSLLLISYKIFDEKWFVEIVWGFIIAFLSSFENLSKKNYVANMKDLFNIQSLYFNEKHYEFKPDDEVWQSVKERLKEKEKENKEN